LCGSQIDQRRGNSDRVHQRQQQHEDLERIANAEGEANSRVRRIEALGAIEQIGQSAKPLPQRFDEPA
jgi:hypothetical protein